jgi:hypothetical protein
VRVACGNAGKGFEGQELALKPVLVPQTPLCQMKPSTAALKKLGSATNVHHHLLKK